MSQINQILERVAEVEMTMRLGGQRIVAAYPYVPADPPSAQCPFFVNEVAGGPTEFAASGVLQQVTTRIILNLCIGRRESDTSLIALEDAAYQWRDVLFSTFAHKIKLSNAAGEIDLPFVHEAHITAWDLFMRPFGTAEFVVVMAELTVQELFVLTVGA